MFTVNHTPLHKKLWGTLSHNFAMHFFSTDPSLYIFLPPVAFSTWNENFQTNLCETYHDDDYMTSFKGVIIILSFLDMWVNNIH